MKQIAVNLHVFACHCSWAENELAYYVTTEPTTTPTCPSGYITVYSGQVIIEEPARAALIVAAVARLQNDQKAIDARAAADKTKIEEQIRNMLALSFTPTEPSNVA